MVASWAAEELKGVEFGDKRLNKRLCAILDQFGAHPTASIPAACGGSAELAAAYRFFDNEKTSFEEVLRPHIESTRLRMAAQPVVVLAQDTSELDLTRPEQQVAGAGHLDAGPRRGLFLHPLHAFTPQGTPLGTVRASYWTRDEAPPAMTKAEKRAALRAQPIEEKESFRWIEALRHAREEARRLAETRIVCVADSEADIYEFLAEAQQASADLDWIVRACQDRAVRPDAEENAESSQLDASTAKHVRERVLREPVLYADTIEVRGRKPKVGCEKRGRRQARESRATRVEVRAAQVTLCPPSRPDRKLPAITVNAVLVREVDPPPGEIAVEWLLLTSLPISNVEEVRAVIEYYKIRWLIEVFFRTLKSGCRVEDRRFEQIDRFLPCLAVYLIVTWRTLFVCRLGRAFPDISCEVVFEPAEWKSVQRIVRRKPPPAEPPTLRQMVRMVAQLGGYVNRPRNDEPGPQTVWIGLQRLHDIANCWKTFGPEARQDDALV